MTQFEKFAQGQTKQPFVLSYYLALNYPYTVWPDYVDGGYVITFDDLTGCMTQCESADEIETMAEDAKRGWLTAQYERGEYIPHPFERSV